MKMISDFSFDLVEEILSRVPITSLGKVRSTCKRWNSLSKEESFTKKHCGKEYLVNLTCGGSSCKRRLSLHNIKDLLSVKEIGQIPKPVISKGKFQVYYFDGLLLYNPEDDSRGIMVWNPFLAQTRWIGITNADSKSNLYAYWGSGSCAVGYDNNNNLKVLGSFYDSKSGCIKYGIYYFKSYSWRFLDIATKFDVYLKKGVSLNGNTYFVGTKPCEDSFVICFDFTTERFGPKLHLPFHHTGYVNNVIITSVRDEQLAVLHHNSWDTRELEIRITTKIEPNMISWSKFFTVEFRRSLEISSFFIDKKKKVAVVCGRYTSYVVGVDKCYEQKGFKGDVFSYVPSSVFVI